jgi:hypothetical protein
MANKASPCPFKYTNTWIFYSISFQRHLQLPICHQPCRTRTLSPDGVLEVTAKNTAFRYPCPSMDSFSHNKKWERTSELRPRCWLLRFHNHHHKTSQSIHVLYRHSPRMSSISTQHPLSLFLCYV